MPHLKELIETSVVGTEELPRHPRKDGIVAFIPLYNDAIIDDVPYNTKIWIGKDKKGNLFYDVKLESTETGGVENQSTVSSDALNMSITPETTNVKPLTQRTQANGYYDAELKVIVLGRNMNTMTLPHEMAHFWLDNTFSMFKKASKGELTIKIDGELLNAHLTIKEDNLGNYVWDLQVKEKSQLTRTGNKPGVEGISITSITPETTNVKPLTQGTQSNGYYDAELKVIVLGRNMNTMTLHHEILDFYLRFCRLLILRLVRLASENASWAELKLICASMINNIPKYAGATQESSAVFCDAAW